MAASNLKKVHIEYHDPMAETKHDDDGRVTTVNVLGIVDLSHPAVMQIRGTMFNSNGSITNDEGVLYIPYSNLIMVEVTEWIR